MISFFRKVKIDLDQLDAVEVELGIRLPAEFKALFTRQAFLFKLMRKLSRDGDHIGIANDFAWLLHHNKELLKLPAESGPFKNKICIGTDGCGNDAFIELSGDDKRVFVLDHELASEHYTVESGLDWEHPDFTKYSDLRAFLIDRIKLYARS